MDEPTFSAVLTTYNGTDHVKDALDSIQEQRYPDVEIVIVDDASRDNTVEVIENHAIDPDVFLQNEENLGIPRNLNRAIRQTSGEYIALIDQDDTWHPEKIAEHVTVHGESGAAVVYSDFDERFVDRDVLEPYRAPDPETSGCALVAQFLREHNFIRGLSNTTIRRSAWERIGGFDETLRLAADYDLWFRLAEKYSFERIPQTLMEKRTHGENFSTNRDINYEDVRYILHKVSLRNPELQEEIWAKRREEHFKRAWESYKERRPATAAVCTLRSLRWHTKPSHDETGFKPHGLVLVSLLDIVTGELSIGNRLLTLRNRLNS